MNWMIRQYRGFRIWWATLRGRPINIRWFGADHTGRKDSTQALQRAYDHAAKIVKVPKGKFNLKEPRSP